jgi:hypothetical protein
VVAKVGERLVLIKQAVQKFYGEIFNVRKLNNLEVWKQYQIEIANSIRLRLQTDSQLWRT